MRRTNPTALAGIPALIAAVLCGLAAGCGGSDAAPAQYPVAGKVSFNGAPAKEGTISFLSDKGVGGESPIGPDGTFSVKNQHGSGLPEGDYKVMIAPPPETSAPSLEASRTATAPKEYSEFPKKYRAFGTSGLTAKVTKDKGAFDFDMKDK
jgi:hypothetical protein